VLNEFLAELNKNPESISFDNTMLVIQKSYHYTPTTFSNGLGESKVINEAGSNEGSCKIFAFAGLNKLTEEQTLACFGKYYREDVLQHPEAVDHANIRNFMRDGWAGVSFDAIPLEVA